MLKRGKRGKRKKKCGKVPIEEKDIFTKFDTNFCIFSEKVTEKLSLQSRRSREGDKKSVRGGWRTGLVQKGGRKSSSTSCGGPNWKRRDK